ncbi:hypothetical protein AB0M22_01445 [Nocardia sp. NPDC051756]|uniref:hypothetical protein n=1 Tax=Nocardia sp. NPDC051756 TaxID=3154751 RepID=UPI00343D7B8C
MGKHSAPRNNVVPARLAMLSTATLIGLAVSANGGAGQAIADDTNSTSASGDGVWVAPPKRALVSVAPVSYPQQTRLDGFAAAPAELPVRRADRPAGKLGGNTKPRSENPGGTGKPGGNTAPLAALVDTLATGSAALPAPLRAVLDDLVKQVGPVLAKGLIQLITSNNQPSPTPAPSPAPKGRHAAPAHAAPAAVVTEDDSDDLEGDDLGSDETDDFAADDIDDATDDISAADSYIADSTDGDDLAVTAADAVPDADADWQPLALGPTTVG